MSIKVKTFSSTSSEATFELVSFISKANETFIERHHLAFTYAYFINMFISNWVLSKKIVEINYIEKIMEYTAMDKIKHEYLRSRAYKCLSLSSSVSSYLSVKLSRYSCLHLGSCIQEFFSLQVC